MVDAIEVTDEAVDLFDCVLNMTLAAYLCDKPDKQIRRMAKKYQKKIGKTNPIAHSVFTTVLLSNQPARVVRVAYDELTR